MAIELPEQELAMEISKESKRHIEKLLEMVPNNVSKLTKENWAKSLWEEIRKSNEAKDNKGKAPIAKVDLDKRQASIGLVNGYANTKPNSLSASKASIMKELPSFIKLDVNEKEVLTISSLSHPSPVFMDTANIQTLMSTPLKAMLTLENLSKVKPKL